MSSIVRHLGVVFVLAYTLNGWSQALPRSYSTPLQLALINPVQFPSDKFEVEGIRLSVLMGVNAEVHGLDLSLLGNVTEDEFGGLAVAGVFNRNKRVTNIYGAQIAGVTNINHSSGSVYGIQAALGANLSKFMDIYGIQIGIYNRARSVYGMQIGLFNYTSNLHGLQIGLANFNEGGPFRVSPIINFGF